MTRIAEVYETEDGFTVAVIVDDEGNVVGKNLYSPESVPQPVVEG
jgi:hypothetical protein